MAPRTAIARRSSTAPRALRSRATTTRPSISSTATSPPGAAARSRSSTIAAPTRYDDLAERVDRFAERSSPGSASRWSSASCSACSTRSIFRRRSSARSRPASCRSPVNTLLTSADYDFMLRDSRARVARRVGAAAAELRAHPRRTIPISSSHRLGRRRRTAIRASPICSTQADGDVRGGADELRRHLLLALFLGLDRHAQGHGASPLASRSSTAELYAEPVLGIARGRRRLLRGEAVLRLRARQRADLPAARSARRRC